MNYSTLSETYKTVRLKTEEICRPLKTEDYVVQPLADVSPPKWHIGHTTWFFETFILIPFLQDYREFNSHFNFVFNSYYETVGARVIRTNRGNLSRPTVEEVYLYRTYVDEHMQKLLGFTDIPGNVSELVLLGLNHEQQHQELLFTDIKYILGHNPIFPAYSHLQIFKHSEESSTGFLKINEGMYKIGFDGTGFCFDNELGRHQVYLDSFEIASNLVSNGEYLEFIKADGYNNFSYWHAEGWEWVKQMNAQAPLYWHFLNGEWVYYTLQGLQPVNPEEPVCHLNFYEASAFATWKGMRLPTEAEWEVASDLFKWGQRWEWTGSAYLPYPGFSKAPGAIGEYNGKFMVNQMVLRGASVATAESHSRRSYRNFFHPQHQRQFTGLRLARQ